MDIAKLPFWNNKKFKVTDLFKNWEQGVLYDPSDIKNYMATWPELVTNWTFENTNGWTAVIWTISAVGWRLRVWKSADNIWRASFQINCVIGRTYYVSLERYKWQNTATNVAIAITHSSVTGAIYTNETSADWLFNFSFTATQTSHWLFLATVWPVWATWLYSEFDNVNIKEIVNATMYQDALWTAPVTWVEQPVWLILDKSKWVIRWPELLSNWDFSSGATWWSIPAWWALTGSTCKATAATDSLKQIASPCIVWKFYEVTFDWTHTSWLLYVRVWVWTAVTFNTSGRKRAILMANGIAWIEFYGWAVSGVVDNISVKEVYWNHAYQTTAIDRPVLRNRYNLLTKTEEFNDATRQKGTSNWTAFPVVTWNYATDPLWWMTADRVQLTLPWDTEWSLVRQVWAITSIPPNVPVTISLWIKATDISQVWKYINLYAYNVTGATYATWNRVSKHILTDEWRRVESTFSFSAQSNSQEFSIWKARGFVVDWILNSETSTDFLIWWAQFVFETQKNIPYQRVDTATIYDSDFSKFPVYLACNWTNTWMRTNNINFNSDKLTWFIWVRMLAGSPMQMLVESSTAYSGYIWAFELTINEVIAWVITPAYRASSGPQYKLNSSNVIPRNVVATFQFDTALTVANWWIVFRENWTALAWSGSWTSTWTIFGNYPLYLFRRAWTTLPFNWNFYWLILRWVLTTNKQIRETEKYLTKKLW